MTADSWGALAFAVLALLFFWGRFAPALAVHGFSRRVRWGLMLVASTVIVMALRYYLRLSASGF